MDSPQQLHQHITALLSSACRTDHPIYGMAIDESPSCVNADRVSYLGKNHSFQPLRPGLCGRDTDYGDWASFPWLLNNRPVICRWDGEIDYELDPDDYTKRIDGRTPSDVSNLLYEGNAMAVVPLLYTCSYRLGQTRYVYFCDAPVSDAFTPLGFRVHGIVRQYMLIPMFYGSLDQLGRIRSLAGQWSAGTITGHQSQQRDGWNMDTLMQLRAIYAASPQGLFFGGALVNVLTDLAVMLTKSTDSQQAFGSGMSSCFTSDDDYEGHWGTLPNPLLNRQFCGGTDGRSFSNIFHSCVLGSNMLWQRDPYTLLVHGQLKVSPDYVFDLTGESYTDTGCKFSHGGFFASTQVIPQYGFVPAFGPTGDETTGYCDHIYANLAVLSVSSRFGCCRSGLRAGLFARSMNHAALNRPAVLENGESLLQASELDESFSWWWNFGCSLMLPGPPAV